MAEKKKDRPTQRSSLVTTRAIGQTLDGCFGLLRTSIRMAGWVIVAGFAYLAVKEVAGKKTEFGGMLEAVVKVDLDRWIFLTVTFLAVYFAKRSDRLRRAVIKEHADYIRELEEKKDPGRSSSNLTQDGKPRKEDLDAP